MNDELIPDKSPTTHARSRNHDIAVMRSSSALLLGISVESHIDIVCIPNDTILVHIEILIIVTHGCAGQLLNEQLKDWRR